MKEEPIRHWRWATDAALKRWAGGKQLAQGLAIVAARRVFELVRTPHGEIFATVGGTAGDLGHFAGVVMEAGSRGLGFSSACSCQRRPCAHAVAVACAIRDAMRAGKPPPRMARSDRRCRELLSLEGDERDAWEAEMEADLGGSKGIESDDPDDGNPY